MRLRELAGIVVAVCTSVACSGAGSTAQPTASPVEAHASPNAEVRIDAFSVPEGSLAEFESAMHENLAFLETLPGFEGHTVFEKSSGPTTFNIVTIATWKSAEAMRNAGEKVREHYRAIGFDMQGSIARWGVTASIGSYHATTRGGAAP